MIAEATYGDRKKNHGRATLPRSARLLKPTDFKRVFAKNVASSDRCFRIIARPSGRSGHRLGMAVSRKVDKTAVGRNRIKRVVRESFRLCWANKTPLFNKAMDIVVLARPASATICNEELFRSLEFHWSKIEQDKIGGKSGNGQI